MKFPIYSGLRLENDVTKWRCDRARFEYITQDKLISSTKTLNE